MATSIIQFFNPSQSLPKEQLKPNRGSGASDVVAAFKASANKLRAAWVLSKPRGSGFNLLLWKREGIKLPQKYSREPLVIWVIRKKIHDGLTNRWISFQNGKLDWLISLPYVIRVMTLLLIGVHDELPGWQVPNWGFQVCRSEAFGSSNWTNVSLVICVLLVFFCRFEELL